MNEPLKPYLIPGPGNLQRALPTPIVVQVTAYLNFVGPEALLAFIKELQAGYENIVAQQAIAIVSNLPPAKET